jgi:hypothetical protein
LASPGRRLSKPAASFFLRKNEKSMEEIKKITGEMKMKKGKMIFFYG